MKLKMNRGDRVRLHLRDDQSVSWLRMEDNEIVHGNWSDLKSYLENEPKIGFVLEQIDKKDYTPQINDFCSFHTRYVIEVENSDGNGIKIGPIREEYLEHYSILEEEMDGVL